MEHTCLSPIKKTKNYYFTGRQTKRNIRAAQLNGFDKLSIIVFPYLTKFSLKSGKNERRRIHEALHQRVFSNQKSSSANTNVKSYWHGLDPHVPLIWHIVQKRIPGSFYPFENDGYE